MKIRSCEIGNFGKLSDRTVNLSDGITVIRGGNESGKSTLSAFIKYILYGFPGKGRDERSNEKIKYTPWNGLKCSGALILEDKDHALYRAERSFDGKNSKGHILDSRGSECFAGTDAGEAFYGADVSAFTKSSFVGQDDIEPDDMKDLGGGLEKFVMQGDKDDAGYEKAAKSLNSEKNKLRNKMRNTGRILELESSVAELKLKLSQTAEKNGRLNVALHMAQETEKKLSETDERLGKLYSEMENIQAYRACEVLSKIATAKDNCDKAKSVCSEKLSSCSMNGFIPDREFLGDLEKAHSEYVATLTKQLAAEDAFDEVSKEYNEAAEKIHDGNNFGDVADTDDTEIREFFLKTDKIKKDASKFKKIAVILALLIVTLPVAAVMLVLGVKKNKEFKKLLSEYGFKNVSEFEKFRNGYDDMYLSLTNVREKKKRRSDELFAVNKKLSECTGQLDKYLSRCGVGSCSEGGNDFIGYIGSELIPEIRQKVYEIEKSNLEYQKYQNAYHALLEANDMEELRLLASKKQDEPPKRPVEEVERALKYDEGARTLLYKKHTDLKSEIAALGASVTDPADVADELFRLEKELSEARKRLDAIELAIEMMDKAANDIRGNAFPSISGRAGELFSKFTGGKYRSLFFDKDFAVRVLGEKDTETRNVGFLSSGAIDTAYIALRVALAEYLCKDKPTLVFDDSFAKIDDERLGNILNVLATLSSEYQIVILTCHKREETILGNRCKVVVMEEM